MLYAQHSRAVIEEVMQYRVDMITTYCYYLNGQEVCAPCIADKKWTQRMPICYNAKRAKPQSIFADIENTKKNNIHVV